MLWFVTCRVIEERFVLHPILSCGLQPPNRHARRALEHLQQRCDKRLGTVIKQGNARRCGFRKIWPVSFRKICPVRSC